MMWEGVNLGEQLARAADSRALLVKPDLWEAGLCLFRAFFSWPGGCCWPRRHHPFFLSASLRRPGSACRSWMVVSLPPTSLNPATQNTRLAPLSPLCHDVQTQVGMDCLKSSQGSLSTPHSLQSSQVVSILVRVDLVAVSEFSEAHVQSI